MSFDGLMTHQVVRELNEKLSSGRINKVQQPYENEIILSIRANRQNYKLLLSAHPVYSRAQITQIPYEAPTQAPIFCMSLRKHLEGAIIDSIIQYENDRIIDIVLSSRDDIGDLHHLVLSLEIMGRHSNIILIDKDDQKIVDCIKHIPISQNSYRTLLPGAMYQRPPKQDKWNPFTINHEKLFAQLQQSDLSPKMLMNNFQGIGKDSAEELYYQLIKANKKSEGWMYFFKTLDQKRCPTLIVKDRKQWLTPIDYITIEGERTYFSTYSELLDAYYGKKAETDRVYQRLGAVTHNLKHRMDKNEQKIIKLKNTLREADQSEILRQKGELLTTFLHDVPKGATHVSLPNYYEENKLLDIPLNPALSPNANAQKYFQKYQKLKKGVKIVQDQIRQTQEENQYLETLLDSLERATPMDISVIEEELINQGYLKQKNVKQHKQKPKSKPYTFYSSKGNKIKVGRNNLQNDQLTLKTAQKNHYWFHAKNIPGSHVILETSHPTDEEITEAATLAAYFSKYRHSAQVPVDVIQVKYIHKPKGAKPGFVVYEGQKTVLVTPETSFIEELSHDK